VCGIQQPVPPVDCHRADTTLRLFVQWQRAGGVHQAVDNEGTLDGVAALEDVLGRAGYRTALEAVAEYTVFLHPETVAQTRGEALFPVTRTKRSGPDRGDIVQRPRGGTVMLDDNTSPALAFFWAAQQRRGPDTQVNHLFKTAIDSDLYTADPDIYTALWNICVTPAFLAKLTDTQRHAHVLAALQRRSFDLYGYVPAGQSPPAPPDGYHNLMWRDCPPPAPNLERVLRSRLDRAPRSRPAKACREIGWCFSNWQPDDALRSPG